MYDILRQTTIKHEITRETSVFNLAHEIGLRGGFDACFPGRDI
jgi:hypothetical protein